MQRPDVIDSRTVLRGYALVAFVGGLAIVGYRWPIPLTLSRTPLKPADLWSLTLMLAAMAVWLSCAAAAGLARIENAIIRRRMVLALAGCLIAVGLLYFAPAYPLLRVILPDAAPWIAIVPGLVLLYASTDRRFFERRTAAAPGSITFHDMPSSTLRTHYEEQIRRAARQEERARLARDLHDAVKQQLFAIQTAAATAETRFDADASGARIALTQVRAAARDALTEMEAMLDQLQANPLTTAGLVESVKRACEATRFRTGADVTFEAGELPPDVALDPGAHQAMLRFAQEALANVARHARAHHVRVRLGLDQEWTPPGSQRRRFVLSIGDDGLGFDTTIGSRGMGLRNMAARAAEAGGTMELTSAPGQGTTVRLTVVNEAATTRTYMLQLILSTTAIVVLILKGLATGSFEVWLLPIAIVFALRAAMGAYRVRSWR